MTLARWVLLCGMLLFIAFYLMGCAALGFDTTRIEVPIPVPCNPPAIQSPSRPIDGLGEHADVYEFSRALWATVESLEGYTQHLEAAVAACRG